MYQKTNPKIMYLTCKNLIKNLPLNYNDVLLRAVYDRKAMPRTKYENDIVEIWRCINDKNPINASTQDVADTYLVCTKQNLSHKKMPFVRWKNLQDIVVLARAVSGIKCDRILLFQLLLYFGQNNINTLIIPYKNYCRNMYYAIMREDYKLLNNLYFKLLTNTHKHKHCHPIKDNVFAKAIVYQHVNEFLSSFNAKYLGICGSLASGEGNEFSDLNLVVFYDDNKDINMPLKAIYRFWKRHVGIPIDIRVVGMSHTCDLPIGVQQTIRII